MTTPWQPTASIETLQQRALIIQSIRNFFIKRDVLEVETPILGNTTTTDLHIDSLTTHCVVPGYETAQQRFLQTSPEFHMKRLLAAGSGAIFQISKAFRCDMMAKHHNPEFTLLEWYRPGFDQHALMAEVDALLQCVLTTKQSEKITYQALFETAFDCCPFTAPVADLHAVAIKHDIHINLPVIESERDTWLHLLMSHIIEPTLGHDSPVFIYDYPLSQGGFAKVNADAITTARFEVYVNGIELANGYHEIIDAVEQKTRFDLDNQKRSQAGLPPVPVDATVLAALEYGLPDCAGVALGIDRLVMLALNETTIESVISFPITNA